MGQDTAGFVDPNSICFPNLIPDFSEPHEMIDPWSCVTGLYIRDVKGDP